MLLDIQLQWIRNLQGQLRSPWMDAFFTAWDLVDTLYFSVIVISLIWYLWDRRIGTRLFYIFVIGVVVNKFLKVFFQQPRPCHIDPSVGIICFESHGFPSGAAQTAALLCGLIFIECQRTIYRALAVVFAIMLCFSRVYLGVHYPTDILGGLAIGGCLLLIYWKVFPLFTKIWKISALIFPFFLLLFLQLKGVSFLAAISLGVAIGLLKDGQTPKKFNIRAYQFFSVLAGIFLLFVAERLIPSLSLFWCLVEGFWLSFLGGWLVTCRDSCE